MARGISFSGAVLFLLLFGAALAAFIVVRHGVSARDQPTQAEIFVARRLRHLAIPMSARGMSSPHPATAETVQAGMEHFADHCAICHGNDGSGDTEMGKNMYPKPPDMRKDETQSLSDGELFYIIENGVRFTGMPGWRTDSNDADAGSKTDSDHDAHGEAGHDTWALVHFIRHLPKLTDEEVTKMKSLNPKSPEEIEEEQQMKQFLEGGKEAPAEKPVEKSSEKHEHHHED
jgi:hypothetical protein